MKQDISNKVIDFVKNNPSPSIFDLLMQDAPQYQLITALAEALIGQTLLVTHDKTNGTVDFLSADSTSVLQITVDGSAAGTLQGFLADDLKAFLSAIRIHEVESYDLVMLPPDMRRANLDYLCQKEGITSDRLRRLTEIWVVQK